MDNLQSVKKIFLPLASRLLLFETKEYLDAADNEFINDRFITDFPFEEMISEISVQANLFDNEDIYWESKKYEKKVRTVLKSLEPKLDVSEEKQKKLMNDWKFELYTYLDHLEIIQSQRSKVLSRTKENVPEIKLPENFTVPDVLKNFSPFLNKESAALFLYYLRQEGILPNYTNIDLASLSKPFFAVSGQKAREELTHISTLRENDDVLKELKRMLETILKTVNKDLE